MKVGTRIPPTTDGGKSSPVEPAHTTYSIERRPSLKSAQTAPANEKPVSAAAITMERRNSRAAIPSPAGSVLKEQLDRERGKMMEDKALREAREKAAQDVAFEREYVIVDKKQELQRVPQCLRGHS